ncbi:hypothetical protein PENSPDRAFT_654333 [Peniophora sp. CONT]|nr:hypothetical protein PENSPDRAFT_654333 [Peniophora sp. CONT]
MDNDLAYPSGLLDKDHQDSSAPPREKNLGARVFAGAKLEKGETSYPTLGRAVWVLSQLGEFVQPAIFADLASEALALTRASLAPAAARLPPLDGALFRARHLLILKELARGPDLGLGAIPSSSSSSSTAPPPLTRTVSTLLPPTHLYGDTMPTNGEGGLAEMFSGLLGRAGGMLPVGVQDSLGFARPGEGVDAKHVRSCYKATRGFAPIH